MYKSKTKIFLLSLMLIGSTNIYASSSSNARLSFGIDAGRADAHKSCDGLIDCDNDDASLRADIGYQFSDIWSAEFGYTSFGTLFRSADDNFNASQKASAWTLSGLGKLPMGELIDLYGRLGIARYETNNSGTVQGVPVRNYNDVKPYIGAGMNFNLTNQFSFRVEYQVYADISRVDGSNDNVQGLYAGAKFYF